MAKFTYVAKNKEGATIKGELDAPEKGQALDILRGKGFLILKLEQLRELSNIFSSFKSRKGKKVSLDDLVVFSRQLATLIESGIPVVSSLDILSEQADNETLKSVLIDVRDSVNTGSSLSDALLKHSALFSSLFVNMVRAGESSGSLDVVLDRIATYQEKMSALQKKIKSALIYPMVVSGMAVAITLIMLLKVIPVFKDIFSGFGAKLPTPTQILINISDFLINNFVLLIIFFIVLGIAVKKYIDTPKGRALLDKHKLRLPIVGPLITKVAISKFTRTLSTLLNSGVPILTALEIVAKTSGNVIVERSVDNVKESVREGESVATPMERSGIFPRMVTRMVSVGEKTGELEKMLTKISDFYDEQVDTSVEGLTSLIEPLVIAFLGIVIGGIVICMFLPIFKISTIINF